MNRHLYFTLLCATMLSLVSCAYIGQDSVLIASSDYINRQHLDRTIPDSLPPNKPSAIALYTKDKKPLSPYRVIGVAKVAKRNVLGMHREDKTVRKMMKKLAASIGGDAIIIGNDGDNMVANVIQFQRVMS